MLWGMINTVQIIVLTPLLNVRFAANGKMFFSTLISMANFDIFPCDMMYNWLLSFEDVPMDKTNFIEMGFE